MKRLTKEEIIKELKKKGFSVRSSQLGIKVSINNYLCSVERIDDLGVDRWHCSSQTVDNALKDIQYGRRFAFS